ncbi:MAG TPA: sigma-70 family RNA polymerase sigma factor [Candidatus Acidoferrales bacterium]|nr:sigma-70 family RNA polymerase sigma factor [Candidatus Acidoferrales bacterium]
MREDPEPSGELVALPAGQITAVEIALEELELVYAFIFARVGNRADAEDLTQQVAMKAIPRLRAGASAPSVRAYLFATARSVLAGFWGIRLGLPEEELHEDLALDVEVPEPSGEAAERVETLLAALPANYRRVLELRFLRGYSLKEVAKEIGSTVGAVKVMQLRALRAAARTGPDA